MDEEGLAVGLEEVERDVHVFLGVVARGVHAEPLLAIPATTLARSIDGALYAASSNVPWATLLARTFEVDVKACARCGGRLEVRAVVTDLEVARRSSCVDTAVVYEPAIA